MLYGPDLASSDDEDGFSDDNEYYEFKEKLKAQRLTQPPSQQNQKENELKAIFAAVTYGKQDVVAEALEKGLPVDTDLDQGWTPLLLAATTANPSVVLYLIEKGANVNQSRDGTTALMLVCNINSNAESTEKNVLECVKLLAEKGADLNAVDNKGRTAIMFAANNGHLDAVSFLLPSVNREAVDGQRWNILFYAVDGDHKNVVEFLISENFALDKTDIRGNTVLDLAYSSGFQHLLELFPKDPFDEFYAHLYKNQTNFEMFEHLAPKEKPQFFADVCKILYGTRSENVMQNLWDNNVGLFDFLSMNDDKLQALGIKFPYQRNRIMEGLFKFHKHPFKPTSIPFIKKNQLYSNLDVSTTILTGIKQLLAVEASLRFIVENRTEKLSLPDSKEAAILISKNRYHIKRILTVTEELTRRTLYWDSLILPADRITKCRRNIPWSSLWLSLGLLSLSFIALYKFKSSFFIFR